MKAIYVLFCLPLFVGCVSTLSIDRNPEFDVRSQALIGDPVYRSKIGTAGTALTRELIYSGVANGELRLSYREYTAKSGKGSLIRPAFAQEVHCDFSDEPITVNFQTVEISVINANAAEIEYIVVSGFRQEKEVEEKLAKRRGS